MDALGVMTADGVRLLLRHTPARGPRRGAILAMHAMWVDGRYFDRPAGRGFASAMAERGLDCFVLDFRGHGLSDRPARGWTLEDYVQRDLPVAIERIEQATGLPPGAITWIGHSLGGLVSLAALSTRVVPAPRALVLATTNIWRHPPLSRRIFIEAFDASARLFGRAPIRALRLGTDDEPASYVGQLAGWVRSGRFTSADGAVDYDAGLGSIALPVLSVVGRGDLLCRPEDARDLTDRLRAAHVEEIVVGRRDGFALDATHFTLWTSGRARPLWDRIARFCAEPPG